jgi:hypothetical protein
MKRLIVATFVGLTAAAAASQFGPIHSLLDDIYPKNAAKAQALRLCILANPNFNRLDGAARDACYHHAFGERASVSPAPAPDLKSSYQVDLRPSAATVAAVSGLRSLPSLD